VTLLLLLSCTAGGGTAPLCNEAAAHMVEDDGEGGFAPRLDGSNGAAA